MDVNSKNGWIRRAFIGLLQHAKVLIFGELFAMSFIPGMPTMTSDIRFSDNSLIPIWDKVQRGLGFLRSGTAIVENRLDRRCRGY